MDKRINEIKRMWHEGGDIDDKAFYWLIEQAEKTEIYKESLENIEALSFFSDGFSDKEKFVAALYHAKKALEGTE